MSSTVLLDINTLAEIVTQAAQPSGPVIVGVDGPGASGKSTLAAQLRDALVNAAIVHMDDFFLPTGQRVTGGDAVGPHFDVLRLARQVLTPAAAGQPLRYQRYDWNTDTLADWIDVPSGLPVIVEGVCCLAAQLRAVYTYAIFCRADPTVRLRRGLERDGEGARSHWVDEWMPAEDAYVSSHAPEEFADLVVDSTSSGDGAARFEIVRQPLDSGRSRDAARMRR